MKRVFATIVAIALLAALAMPALAVGVTMYAQKDGVKVYEKKSTHSDVIDELSIGQKVTVEKESGKWYYIMIEYGEVEMRGWAAAKHFDTRPPETECDHQWTAWEVYREATCTAEGLSTRHCKLCGKGDVKVLEKLPHDFSRWIVVREATCAEEGEQIHWCKMCGFEERESIEKLPHEFGDWMVVREATCTLEGVRMHWCRNCGYEEESFIKKVPHEYGGWKVVIEATDHSAGTRAKTCRNCGQSEQESFDPAGTLRKGSRGSAVREIQQLLVDQAYLKPGGVDGSYGGGTEKALMQFQKDQGLNPDGVAWPQTIDRLRHEFGKWKTVSKLTRSTDGVRVRTCRKCGFEESQVTPAGTVIARNNRGENVRNIQQMLNDIGYNAGKADGAYGPKLDSAFTTFAFDHDIDFEAGTLKPGHVDALVNAWIEFESQGNWMGKGDRNSPVNLMLTVVQTGMSKSGLIAYNWSLANMGTEKCRLNAVLLGYGEDCDFMGNNLAMAVDGTVLKPGGANRASGSFTVSEEWGDGANILNFCAVGTSEKSDARWMSNVRTFELGE